MTSEKCRSCGERKIECEYCRGRGFFDLTPFGTADCDRCNGRGIKCPRAWRGTDC
ncbi:MAG TPA: YuiA family protein [Micromonosporaceae bacterium]